MNTLNTSTLAALEEMLQNTARPAPFDYLPIYFQGGTSNRNISPLGQLIGCINPEFIPYIHESLNNAPIPHIQFHADKLIIEAARPAILSLEITDLANRMRLGGFIPGWRNEQFAWLDDNGHEYFRIERAAFRTFGFRSMATHVTGYTLSGCIWLGRRSESKSTDPSRLDNLAAGGVSADETPWSCTRRELWEEAGVPLHIAEHADPVGRIHMRRPILSRGFHDELLYVYDLELPENFVPTNHDGEVSGFIEVSIAEAAARILADEFTNDAALVTADFILRTFRTPKN